MSRARCRYVTGRVPKHSPGHTVRTLSCRRTPRPLNVTAVLGVAAVWVDQGGRFVLHPAAETALRCVGVVVERRDRRWYWSVPRAWCVGTTRNPVQAKRAALLEIFRSLTQVERTIALDQLSIRFG